MSLQSRLAQAAATGKLDVYGMQLTSLPPLPANLRELNCGNNNLTELPALPKGLQILNCAENKLTSLPYLPPNLVRLICTNNNLTKLPALPASLRVLECSHNKLISLPKLPDLTNFDSLFGNNFIEPFRSLVQDYQSRKRKILTDSAYTRDPQLYVLAHHSALLTEFIQNVNAVSKEPLKENLIAARFSTKAIQRNLNRNQVNPNNTLSEANWDKYFTRRGEVWTQGVGQAYGPWRGGKRSGTKRRKSKKSKTHKKRT